LLAPIGRGVLSDPTGGRKPTPNPPYLFGNDHEPQSLAEFESRATHHFPIAIDPFKANVRELPKFLKPGTHTHT